MNNFKYSCFFCKYNTNSSQAWYQHNKGKKHMKNVQIAEQNKDCDINTTSVHTSTPCINVNTSDNGIDKSNELNCIHCNKIFKRKCDLNYHVRNRCKKNPKLEEKKKLEDEKKKLDEEEEKRKLEDEKRKLEDEKKKLEDEKQKFMIQFMEKQAEEQRKREEKQAEEQRKREEKLMEMFISSQNNNNNIKEEIMGELKEMLKSGNNTDQSHNHHKHCLDLQLTSEYKLEHRPEDGYINVTGLCQAANKKISNWFQLDKTKAFIEVLSTNAGIPEFQLTYISKGKKSWVHPQIAVNIAQWISPEFDVLVSKWVYEIMATGGVHVYNTKPYKELDELNKTNIKRIKELESKYLKKQKSKNY